MERQTGFVNNIAGNLRAHVTAWCEGEPAQWVGGSATPCDPERLTVLTPAEAAYLGWAPNKGERYVATAALAILARLNELEGACVDCSAEACAEQPARALRPDVLQSVRAYNRSAAHVDAARPARNGESARNTALGELVDASAEPETRHARLRRLALAYRELVRAPYTSADAIEDAATALATAALAE